MNARYTSAQLEQAINSHPTIAELITDDTIQSWPIPVMHGNRLMFHFFFYETLGGGELNGHSFISFPHFRVLADPNVIDNIKFMRVGPKDFGMNNMDCSSPYAKKDSNYLSNLTPHQCLILVNALYRLTDEIILFYLKPQHTLNKCDKSIIIDYHAVFQKLTQKSLLPLYRAVNPMFFEWIKSIPADNGASC